eukprot:PhM_4_TR10513/c1_g1_i2/m.53369
MNGNISHQKRTPTTADRHAHVLLRTYVSPPQMAPVDARRRVRYSSTHQQHQQLQLSHDASSPTGPVTGTTSLSVGCAAHDQTPDSAAHRNSTNVCNGSAANSQRVVRTSSHNRVTSPKDGVVVTTPTSKADYFRDDSGLLYIPPPPGNTAELRKSPVGATPPEALFRRSGLAFERSPTAPVVAPQSVEIPRLDFASIRAKARQTQGAHVKVIPTKTLNFVKKSQPPPPYVGRGNLAFSKQNNNNDNKFARSKSGGAIPSAAPARPAGAVRSSSAMGAVGQSSQQATMQRRSGTAFGRSATAMPQQVRSSTTTTTTVPMPTQQQRSLSPPQSNNIKSNNKNTTTTTTTKKTSSSNSAVKKPTSQPAPSSDATKQKRPVATSSSVMPNKGSEKQTNTTTTNNGAAPLKRAPRTSTTTTSMSTYQFPSRGPATRGGVFSDANSIVRPSLTSLKRERLVRSSTLAK